MGSIHIFSVVKPFWNNIDGVEYSAANCMISSKRNPFSKHASSFGNIHYVLISYYVVVNEFVLKLFLFNWSFCFIVVMAKVCKIFEREFLHHNSLSVIDENCLNDVKRKYDTIAKGKKQASMMNDEIESSS